MALQQFPKTESERWEKIAKCVPGKTKVGVVIDLDNGLKFFFFFFGNVLNDVLTTQEKKLAQFRPKTNYI